MSQSTLGSTPYQNSNLFSGYYLDERIADLDGWDCDDEAQEAFDDLKTLWDLEGSLVDSYKEDELLDEWIDEVLDVLGFGTKSEATLPDSGGYNDRLLFYSPEQRRDAAERVSDGEADADYKLASAVLEAKQWGADFTQRFSEARSYRDASHQIKYYLEHTPETLNWGILTDGKKWRLYGTKDYATEIYYEVDLPELLSTGTLEQFKYFYALFRPEAFREVGGTSFLDTVWNESETAAQELGEDLQDNVFTALRVLGEGFVHQNDLDIDPDDEAARGELKEQSLVLLYRLMFVLYAESRGLIRPDDEDARDEYEEHFSLDELRAEIHEAIEEGDTYEDYSGYSTKMWGQLQDLFELVDEGNEELDIPPYNGGLFDDEEHEFLAEHEVADRHMAEVIHRLGTTVDDDGEYVLADYADLDTRHLGSIYEGLLEHEFRIAGEQYAAVSEDGGQVWKPATEVSVADAVETVEAGELYVVNDDGERKATGAYYTPDYVVSYIVEETIDPLLDDIKSELEADGLEPSEPEYFRRFWQSVLDLKVLDPAMGSAHFLTSATGYLTEQVMEVVREQEIQGYDEQHLRREIAKECIYGVDVNGMAVELGKLSMWLETLAADQPLAFLDHHLKPGNSLVGSDITEVLSDDVDDEGGQLTLMQVAARARRDTLEHVMELMQELLAIDNETLDDIKSMEELYDEIRDDPLYKRLFEIANVHTAEEFGLDVPEGVYEDMAGAIEDGDEWADIQGEDWFTSAQAMADEEDFFHWELEYPEVFFGEDGEKRKDAGFDAVVGNPPWVNIGRESGNERTVDYVNSVFETAEYQVDLYTLFLEKSMEIVGKHQFVGMIVPDPWLNNYRTPKIRELLLVKNTPLQIVSTPPSAFPEVGAEHLIGVFRDGDLPISGFDRGELASEGDVEYFDNYPTDLLSEDDEYVVYSNSNVSSAIERIESEATPLGELYETIRGVGPYHHSQQDQEVIENREYHSSEKEDETFVPELKGKHLSRYNIHWEGDTWISYGDWLAEPREERFFEGKRLLLREILGERFEVAAIEDEFVTDRGVYIALPDENSPDLYYTLAVLASAVPVFWFREKYNEDDELFPKLRVAHFEMLPIATLNSAGDDAEKPTQYISQLETATSEDDYATLTAEITSHVQSEGIDRVVHDFIAAVGKKQTETHRNLSELNLSLIDHLGSYDNAQTLDDIGLTQPPEGSADSILQQTTEEKPNLRVGEASVKRESPNTVEIRLTARYKPDDEDAHETDQWGYTETEPLPALRITDLTRNEADLIEAFVPVAVDEADGFADFRETATKTNSLVNRLRKLTLPAVDDVRAGLESYTETVERAEELEAKIERTDDLIDEIVYELYGLTDEEIEIVEETVAS
ncbi:TaqI-like C-terminal specificity domain-containing protein [Halobacterium salinarum]|uniref:Eco57I restriction-modification methylase domain-containing protein n=1 Tax=Halobacterium salinarum TaxID=2242 RepID=UPI0025576106|nr:TaqI-like C-terminal specificity domain-containing protein [Halobacterium salinarum]MDL0135969.1 TaqI-like C-terminal specificity domain-containing protein [Halobacterium salinarum]MDL0138966.1 TaqI-like C-terminal specificity domain-containing protein [Halobacterium salinarum]